MNATAAPQHTPISRLLMISLLSAGLACTGMAAAAPAPPSAQMCVACHGADGNSANPALYPNLAGQAPAYLELQLTNFKSGERPNPIMKGIVDGLQPADLHALSAYFGAMPAKAQPSHDKALEAKGRALFTQGSAAGAPACVSCHGPQGHGQTSFPRIASQPAPYALEQLHVYRDVPKFNNPLATMMKSVAVKLSEDEMKAVTAYVATLP